MKHLLLLSALLLASTADAQRGGRDHDEDRPRKDNFVPLVATTEPGIAWYGVLEDAKAEAKRTGRPILLMSAAPQCQGVPGMW